MPLRWHFGGARVGPVPRLRLARWGLLFPALPKPIRQSGRSYALSAVGAPGLAAVRSEHHRLQTRMPDRSLGGVLDILESVQAPSAGIWHAGPPRVCIMAGRDGRPDL